MSGLIDNLWVTRSEGMSGTGADQGALQDSNLTSSNPAKSADQQPNPDLGVGSGQGEGLDRAPTSFGGPSSGRTSKVPGHKSGLLNKLDARIGYDYDEVRKRDLEIFEVTYGNPDDFPDAKLRGTEMAGIGPDQRALRSYPKFRFEEEAVAEKDPSEGE